MRQVDPLEPQPGDRVKVFSLIDEVRPHSPINWDEGIVLENDAEEFVLDDGTRFSHEFDEEFSSVYYIVEDEA